MTLTFPAAVVSYAGVFAATLADNLFALAGTFVVSATAIIVAIVTQGRQSSRQHGTLIREVRLLRRDFKSHLETDHGYPPDPDEERIAA